MFLLLWQLLLCHFSTYVDNNNNNNEIVPRFARQTISDRNSTSVISIDKLIANDANLLVSFEFYENFTIHLHNCFSCFNTWWIYTSCKFLLSDTQTKNTIASLNWQQHHKHETHMIERKLIDACISYKSKTQTHNISGAKVHETSNTEIWTTLFHVLMVPMMFSWFSSAIYMKCWQITGFL